MTPSPIKRPRTPASPSKAKPPNGTRRPTTRVAHYRNLAGWLQIELAAAAGVSLPTIREMERTVTARRFQASTKRAVVAALGAKMGKRLTTLDVFPKV